jgi:hypothetical protein
MRHSDSRQAVADAQGRAEIRWDWQTGGIQKRLDVHRIAISAPPGTPPPQARLYAGGVESDQNFIAGSRTGDSDTATFLIGHLLLSPFEPILLVWTGCTPGDVCTMVIEGVFE